MSYRDSKYQDGEMIRITFDQYEWNRFCNMVDKKQFKKIQDLVSLFVGHFKEYYSLYSAEFITLCWRKGFHQPSCDICNEIIGHILKYGFTKRRSNKKRAKSKITQRQQNQKIGRVFEEFMIPIFQRMGYYVTLTPPSHDYGADIILESHGIKTAVQLKCEKGKVGIPAVQQAYAGKEYYGCQKALVLITSDFTEPAKNLARRTSVELWDSQKYTEILNRHYSI